MSKQPFPNQPLLLTPISALVLSHIEQNAIAQSRPESGTTVLFLRDVQLLLTEIRRLQEALGKAEGKVEVGGRNNPSSDTRMCVRDKFNGQWVPVEVPDTHPCHAVRINPFEGQIGREITERLNHPVRSPNGLKELREVTAEKGLARESEEGWKLVAADQAIRLSRGEENIRRLEALLAAETGSTERLCADLERAEREVKEKCQIISSLAEDKEKLYCQLNRRAEEVVEARRREDATLQKLRDVQKTLTATESILVARVDETDRLNERIVSLERDASTKMDGLHSVCDILVSRGWKEPGQRLDGVFISSLLDILERLRKKEEELSRRLTNLRMYGKEVL